MSSADWTGPSRPERYADDAKEQLGWDRVGAPMDRGVPGRVFDRPSACALPLEHGGTGVPGARNLGRHLGAIRSDGIESAPRWIVVFLGAYLIVHLLALYLWNMVGQAFPVQGTSGGTSALSDLMGSSRRPDGSWCSWARI